MAQIPALTSALKPDASGGASAGLSHTSQPLTLPSSNAPSTQKLFAQVNEIGKLRLELRAALDAANPDRAALHTLARCLNEKTQRVDYSLSRLPLPDLLELKKVVDKAADARGDNKLAELRAKIEEHLPAGDLQQAYLLHRLAGEAQHLRRNGERDCSAPAHVQQYRSESIRLSLAAIYQPLITHQTAVVKQAVAAISDPITREQFKRLLHEKSLEDQRTPAIPGTVTPEFLYFTVESIGTPAKGTPALGPEVRRELTTKHLAPLLAELQKNHAVINAAWNAVDDKQMFPVDDACRKLYHLAKLAETRRDECLKNLGPQEAKDGLEKLPSRNVNSPRLVELLLPPEREAEGAFGLPGPEIPLNRPAVYRLCAELDAAGKAESSLADFAELAQGTKSQRTAQARELDTAKVPLDLTGVKAVVSSEKLLNELKQAVYAVERYEQAIKAAESSKQTAKADELRAGWINFSSRFFEYFQKSAGEIKEAQQAVADQLLKGCTEEQRAGLVACSRKALHEVKDEIRLHEETKGKATAPLALYVHRFLHDERSREPLTSVSTSGSPALLEKFRIYLNPLKAAEEQANLAASGLFGIDVDPARAKIVLSSACGILEASLLAERAKLSDEERSVALSMVPGVALLHPGLRAYGQLLPDTVFFSGTEPASGLTAVNYPKPQVAELLPQLSRFRAVQEISRIAENLKVEPNFPDQRCQTAEACVQLQDLLERIRANGRLAELEEDIAAVCERVALSLENKQGALAVLEQEKDRQILLTGLELRYLPEKTRISCENEAGRLAAEMPENAELARFTAFYRTLVSQTRAREKKEEEQRLRDEAVAKNNMQLREQTEKQVPLPQAYLAERKRDAEANRAEYARSATVPPVLILEALSQIASAARNIEREEQQLRTSGEQDKKQAIARSARTVAEMATAISESRKTAQAGITRGSSQINAGSARVLDKLDRISEELGEVRKALEITEDVEKACELLSQAAERARKRLPRDQSGENQELLATYAAISKGLADVTGEPKYRELHSARLFGDLKQTEQDLFRSYPDYPSGLEPQIARFKTAKALERLRLLLLARNENNDYSLPLAQSYAAVLELASRTPENPALVQLHHDLRAIEKGLRANPGDRAIALQQFDAAVQKQIVLLGFELRSVPAETRSKLVEQSAAVAAAHPENGEFQEFFGLYKQIHERLGAVKTSDKLAARNRE